VVGVSLSGKNVGIWGDVGCFSFYPFKTLGCYGDGGSAVSDSLDIARKIRLMRFNGEDRETGEYLHHGVSSMLDNLQAAFLSAKLSMIDAVLRRRRFLAETYNQHLFGVGDLKLPMPVNDASVHAYQNYVVRTRHRGSLKRHLLVAGIETMVHWRVPFYRHAGLSLDALPQPVTDRMAKEMLSLPLYPELRDEEQEYVIARIKAFFNSGRARMG